MNIDDIVFDTYVICPLCKANLKSISGAHLIRMHGYQNVQEFKVEFGIPNKTALIAKETRKVMQNKGKLRSTWFKEHVMPIGIEMAKQEDLVPKESRINCGLRRRGWSWVPELTTEMKDKGFFDLHGAAEELGIAYNYARKCASDGRIKTFTNKGIRFTTTEWIEDARQLLKENRIKYHKKPRD